MRRGEHKFDGRLHCSVCGQSAMSSSGVGCEARIVFDNPPPPVRFTEDAAVIKRLVLEWETNYLHPLFNQGVTREGEHDADQTS